MNMGFDLQGSLNDYEAEVKKNVEKRFGADENHKVYIYGYGMMGRWVYQQLKDKMSIAGYIDGDKDKQGKLTGENVKIYALEDVAFDSYIIIASLVGWSAIYDKCLTSGYFHCCHYEELAFYDHTLPHWNLAFEGMAESILNHTEKYMSVYNILSDDRSREVLKNVLLFRMTMDINYTRAAYELSTASGEEQYFAPDIITVNDDEVFVDCGGYCGETTKAFINFVREKYNKIYLFEPDAKLVNRTQKDLCVGGGYKDLEIYPYGVGKEECILAFNAIGDESGNFSSEGSEMIRVVKLDDVVKEKVSFIKMDIEGMESEALMGAKQIIKKDKPKLAISVYHKCNDIFHLVEQVLSYRTDYKLYIRHYTPNCDDTVMYFV